MGNPMPDIPIPMDQFIKEVATAAARIALKEHAEACPVNTLKEEVYGTKDRPGLKTRVERVEDEQERTGEKLTGVGTYIRDLSKPVLAAVLVAILFWFFSAKPAKAAQADAAHAMLYRYWLQPYCPYPDPSPAQTPFVNLKTWVDVNRFVSEEKKR